MPFVAPEARSDVGLIVPLGVESLSEEVVGELTGLGETVHTFSNFKVYPAILGKLNEVVLSDEFVGDVA